MSLDILLVKTKTDTEDMFDIMLEIVKSHPKKEII